MKVYLSRFVCSSFEINLKNFEREVERSIEKGAEIVVFPEIFLTGYSQKPSAFKIENAFKKNSKEFPKTLFVFGTYTKNEKNRLTVWYDGDEVAYYEKIHLFYPNKEDKIWKVGNFYSALNFKGKKIGFLICNDIRFPEGARELKLKLGIDLLIVVAWWPLRRDHIWKKLLQVRAIENGIWVLGCCISSSVYEKEKFSGALNYAFDPEGNQILTDDDSTYEILNKKIKILVDTKKEYKEIKEFKIFKIEKA